MKEENILEINNLNIIYETDYGTVYAVNGIDLELGRGQTLGLVGETGAGKTTTALGILRLLPKNVGKITDGTILLDGNDLLTLPEKNMREYRGKKISMIFQDPMTSLNPVIPIGKQIAEVLKLHSDNQDKAAIDARVDEMLELVGIPSSRKKDYPHQFSGGMKQRVVIAIALACEPELLIADEPTTALDVTIQAQVLAMMNGLKETLGTSMILITHDLGVVAESCDRVAVMYAGEIVESGSVECIFDKNTDHHPYTVGLFGSIPDLEHDTERLSPINGLMPDPVNLPKGCKFSPRCPHCTEQCKEQKPSIIDLEGHMIRCNLFGNGGGNGIVS